MKKPKLSWFEIINETVVKNIAGVVLIITTAITLSPSFGRDVAKFMDGIYSYVPQWVWGLISIIIFIGLVVWNYLDYLSKKENELMLLEALSENTAITPENSQDNSNGGTGFQNSVFNGPVIIAHQENKKKDNVKNEFPRLSFHCELIVKKELIESVLDFIERDMKSTGWVIITRDNKSMYQTNKEETKFYSDGIKVSGEKFKRINTSSFFDSKVPELFQLSFFQSGIGEKSKVTIKFDTHILEVCEFFNHLIRILKKTFKIEITEKDRRYFWIE